MKKNRFILTILFVLLTVGLFAQKENALIRNGNKYYKQKQFNQSQQQYRKALEKAPENPTANYNLGNSQFRQNSFEDAAKSYLASSEHATDSIAKESSLYNQGVALVKQKKLEESIASWKNALKLDPNDLDARENLQKAMQELKMKQPPQKKDDKKDDNKKQDKKDQKQEQPPPQSRLTKKQVEQLLKALQQKENEAQEKMNQNKVKSLSQPDKDW